MLPHIWKNREESRLMELLNTFDVFVCFIYVIFHQEITSAVSVHVR